MNSFYTYLYLRDDGTPYYVGKGRGNRVRQKDNRHVPVPTKQFVIIQDFESETEALCAEKFLISFYGRKDLRTGCLRNLTDGGDGVSGYKHSGETRQRISASRQGKTGFIPPRLIQCIRGHDMSGDNVYVRPNDGRRSCVECQRQRCRDYQKRKSL